MKRHLLDIVFGIIVFMVVSVVVIMSVMRFVKNNSPLTFYQTLGLSTPYGFVYQTAQGNKP